MGDRRYHRAPSTQQSESSPRTDADVQAITERTKRMLADRSERLSRMERAASETSAESRDFRNGAAALALRKQQEAESSSSLFSCCFGDEDDPADEMDDVP